jgi:hypothetical protein
VGSYIIQRDDKAETISAMAESRVDRDEATVE